MSTDEQILKKIAKSPEVQAAIVEVAEKVAKAAEGALAPHRRSGRTKVKVKRGRVDRYVVLETTDKLADLLAFEYGHSQRGGPGHTAGARVLGKAVAAVIT